MAKERPPVEVASVDDLRAYYPNQWVAVEVKQVTPEVGITKAQIIAHGRRSDEQTVLAKLKRFRSINPGKEIGLFYTGHFVRTGQDIIVVGT